MADFLALVIPSLVALIISCFALWSIRRTERRLGALKERQKLDSSCFEVQARIHESRLVCVELRAIGNTRDVLTLGNKLADMHFETRLTEPVDVHWRTAMLP